MGRKADGGKTKTPHAPPARGPHTGLATFAAREGASAATRCRPRPPGD